MAQQAIGGPETGLYGVGRYPLPRKRRCGAVRGVFWVCGMKWLQCMTCDCPVVTGKNASKAKCQDCRDAYEREYSARYRRTNAAKEASERYRKTQKAKDAQARWLASEKGKATRAQYRQSPKVKFYDIARAKSDRATAWQREYRNSEAGKAYRAAYIAKLDYLERKRASERKAYAALRIIEALQIQIGAENGQ